MRLSQIVQEELKPAGFGVVGTWEMRERKGIYLGNPKEYFPHPVGPLYEVDCTKEADPDLTEAEVAAIRRRFLNSASASS